MNRFIVRTAVVPFFFALLLGACTAPVASEREPDAPASAEAALSSLTVSRGEALSPTPEFSSDVRDYAYEVPYSVSEVSIDAAAAEGTEVEGTGSFALSVGANVFEITVSGTDGVAPSTYSATVVRRSPPDISFISPAACAEVAAGELCVSGSIGNDPYGEVRAVEVSWGARTAGCAPDPGTGAFSAALDLSGAPNGTQTVVATAYDEAWNALAVELRNVVVSGSAAEGWTVSGSVANGTALAGGEYLTIMLSPWYEELGDEVAQPVKVILPVPVADASFPYSFSFEGVPGGDYDITAVLLDSPELAEESRITHKVLGPQTVSANVELPPITLGP